MRKSLAFIYLCLMAIGVSAQTSDDVAFYQSIWGMEKRAIVEAYMDGLTMEEKSAFWTEYDAYELSRKDLGKERVEILGDYAENYGSLSDDKAADLINRAVANNIAIQKLLKKTFKKMSKSVGAVKAAKFVQLENYFLINIQMLIQESIPFVDEFK